MSNTNKLSGAGCSVAGESHDSQFRGGADELSTFAGLSVTILEPWIHLQFVVAEYQPPYFRSGQV